MAEFTGDSGRLFGWALDFVRAYRSRPLWARVIARLAMGRSAYRELCGMNKILAEAGWGPGDQYSCAHMDYHKERVGQL